MLKRAKTTGYHAWLAHALSRTRRKDCSKGLAEVIKGLGERELVLLRRARGRHASREGWSRWGDGVRDSSDLGCPPGWSWYAGLQKLDRLSMRVLAASEVLRKPAGGQWRDSMGVRAGARATGEVGGVNRNYDIICGMNGIRGRSITCRSFALPSNN
ncbi:hypothetical protein OOU_Y34scaffold00668g18 [Pyricularia oryzae Y34]|uniref:Uncharacterized protein n=2 Tax=Pyricularia oryzae TaxID=318829 RepID=A0AA97NTV5_PYRO3|nr:hypothetical protein OOU_Y34scaffold00668g18 [Pyricularia oryzae Y34]